MAFDNLQNLNVDFIREKMKEIIDISEPIDLLLIFAFTSTLFKNKFKETKKEKNR